MGIERGGCMEIARMSGVVVGRLTVLCAAASMLAMTVYRAPAFRVTLRPDVALLVIAVGAIASLVVASVALLADTRTVRRVAWELIALGAALVATEVVLEAALPARAVTGNVQRLLATEIAAREQGIAFDSRLRSEIVRALRAEGADALPGVVGGWASDPSFGARLPPDAQLEFVGLVGERPGEDQIGALLLTDEAGNAQLDNGAQTRRTVAEYIDRYYNDTRRHSYLDFVSPLEYEMISAH